MDEIVSLAKRRGFVYQTSEIYGGLANSYDYGPMGVELLKNIKDLWWKEFIQKRPDMVGIDTQIILHPKTWEASGHVTSFTEPLVEDKVTHKRYRADHLIEGWLGADSDIKAEDMTVSEMAAFIKENKIKSPDGNEITEPKAFNVLFETALGSVEGGKQKAYLRGETAQGIFTNFKQVLGSTRIQLPFGIGQIGKSFRNEITTGQFVFRTLEFEQAEIEYFFDPEVTDWEKLMLEWKESMMNFIVDGLGINKENLRWRRHTDKERSHYSKDTFDLDYQFPFGWKELWGIAYRTDYDLKQHMEFSGQSLEYTDPISGRKFVPHVLEPAIGVNRMFFMVLNDAYYKDKENGRKVLKVKPSLAPYKAAVFPLLANKPELVAKAQTIYNILNTKYAVAWDDRGNIGKRYFAQDEVGTPFCITVDFDTLKDDTVTVRDRDTAKQERVSVEKLNEFISSKLE